MGRVSTRVRVLLVEDDEDSRALLAELLQDEFDVRTAADGRAGLDACSLEPPDVLITDESLPGLRGTELAREVKARHPSTRVVLVSGYAKPPGTEACDLVLKKPVDVDTLARALTQLMHPQSP